MARFSDDFLESLKDGADIVGIIGEHVKLKRMGAQYRGPCPFHGGKNPNFSVDPSKGFYHCFKCGVSGTAVTFMQKHLGMEWADAVREVANRSGIVVPEPRDERRGPDPRERYWEVNAAAAAYFQKVLWEDERAAPARAYLAKREITREVADRFQLGFAPYEVGLFRESLGALGFDEPRLLEAGLMVKREEIAEPRPRFRRRLMFPILDAQGHVAGFGGRALGDEEPKYLNSAEGEAFTKRRLLYGLHVAKNHMRKEDRALVVEGYFDAIRLMAAGIECVVAPLGTALTEEQVALLTRYTRNVFLLYDGDEAGQKATFRSGLELLRAGAQVRVVTLPGEDDPDSFVQAKGGDALLALLGQGIDLFERQVQLLERAGYFADLHKKRTAVDKLLPTLRATRDPVTRDIYVGRLAEVSGVSAETLVSEMRERPPRAPSGGGGGGPMEDPTVGGGEDGPPVWDDAPPPTDEAPAPRKRPWEPNKRWGKKPRGPEWLASEAPLRPAKGGEVRFERDLLRLCLVHRTYIERVLAEYGPEAWRDALAATVFTILRELGPDVTLEELAEALEPAAVQLVQQLVQEADAVRDAEDTFGRGIVAFRVRELEEARADVGRRMLQVDGGDEKDALFREKGEISIEIAALKKDGWKAYDRMRN
jgi:DNA primase